MYCVYYTRRNGCSATTNFCEKQFLITAPPCGQHSTDRKRQTPTRHHGNSAPQLVSQVIFTGTHSHRVIDVSCLYNKVGSLSRKRDTDRCHKTALSTFNNIGDKGSTLQRTTKPVSYTHLDVYKRQ